LKFCKNNHLIRTSEEKVIVILRTRVRFCKFSSNSFYFFFLPFPFFSFIFFFPKPTEARRGGAPNPAPDSVAIGGGDFVGDFLEPKAPKQLRLAPPLSIFLQRRPYLFFLPSQPAAKQLGQRQAAAASS